MGEFVLEQWLDHQNSGNTGQYAKQITSPALQFWETTLPKSKKSACENKGGWKIFAFAGGAFSFIFVGQMSGTYNFLLEE